MKNLLNIVEFFKGINDFLHFQSVVVIQIDGDFRAISHFSHAR